MRYNFFDLSLFYTSIVSIKACKFYQLLSKFISFDHDLKESNLFSAADLHLQGRKRLDFSKGFKTCQFKEQLAFSLPHSPGDTAQLAVHHF